MKNVKKLICVALMLALTVTLLCACGDEEEKEKLPFIGSWKHYYGDYDKLEAELGMDLTHDTDFDTFTLFEDGTGVIENNLACTWKFENDTLWIIPGKITGMRQDSFAYNGKVTIKNDLLIMSGAISKDGKDPDHGTYVFSKCDYGTAAEVYTDKKKPFVGSWERYDHDPESLENVFGMSFDHPPFDSITLFEDGTGIVDNEMPCTWKYENGTLWIVPGDGASMLMDTYAFAGKVVVKNNCMALSGIVSKDGREDEDGDYLFEKVK